jgi:uncharacterized membrane protein YgdD (TMEM256/DUF423 family)
VNRWVALLIAVVVGGILASVLLLPLAGAFAGALWVFMFGDDPWPAWVEPVAGVVIVLGWLGLWAAAAWAIWTRIRPKA